MEELALFAIGLVLSGIMLILKVAFFASLGYFWVLLPLMLCTGFFFFFSTDGDFF